MRVSFLPSLTFASGRRLEKEEEEEEEGRTRREGVQTARNLVSREWEVSGQPRTAPPVREKWVVHYTVPHGGTRSFTCGVKS